MFVQMPLWQNPSRNECACARLDRKLWHRHISSDVRDLELGGLGRAAPAPRAWRACVLGVRACVPGVQAACTMPGDILL